VSLSRAGSELAPDVPAVVVGDELRLQQVLCNLVGNACKFADRGAIVIRVALADTAQSCPRRTSSLLRRLWVTFKGR
jgi:signal transduction histidine kinase